MFVFYIKMLALRSIIRSVMFTMRRVVPSIALRSHEFAAVNFLACIGANKCYRNEINSEGEHFLSFSLSLIFSLAFSDFPPRNAAAVAAKVHLIFTNSKVCRDECAETQRMEEYPRETEKFLE